MIKLRRLAIFLAAIIFAGAIIPANLQASPTPVPQVWLDGNRLH